MQADKTSSIRHPFLWRVQWCIHAGPARQVWLRNPPREGNLYQLTPDLGGSTRAPRIVRHQKALARSRTADRIRPRVSLGVEAAPESINRSKLAYRKEARSTQAKDRTHRRCDCRGDRHAGPPAGSASPRG